LGEFSVAGSPLASSDKPKLCDGIDHFEEHTKYRDFKKFHIERARLRGALKRDAQRPDRRAFVGSTIHCDPRGLERSLFGLPTGQGIARESVR
jgi:hypothetical protein